MHKFFIEQTKVDGNNITIDGDEFYHISKVLRKKVGDKIVIINGTETTFFCKIIKMEKTYAIADIYLTEFCETNPKHNISICQGLPKGEKLELIIQKTTELGASELAPFTSEFTVAKGNPIKQERMQKISREACKQCGRSIPLKITKVLTFKELLDYIKDFDLCLFVYEKAKLENQLNKFNEEIIRAKSIAIIIGAEGGFSESESKLLEQKNVKSVSLGKRILRTETASIALTAYISFLKNN